jgi:hypothetical protein
MMQIQENVLPSGTVLHGHYRIEYTLSKGGFGNIYVATDTKTGRKVAVKEAFFSDPHTEAQFAIEAQVLISHSLKGVVRGSDHFQEKGRFYLVMEYIEGKNVEELQIAHFERYQRPLPEHTVLLMMALMCAATQELHDLRVIHRDIKPANVKIDASGQPILLDLGLAKMDPETKTLLAAQAYTPGYAPPEQCQEGGITDARTDVYALGATIYYSLTGRQPWDAIKRLAETHTGHPDMPTPRDHAPWLSPTTNAVVMQALALDPALRFASANAMQGALEGAYQALGPVTLCANCHAVNAGGADFCAECGASLKPPPSRPNAQAAIIAAAAPPEAPTMILPPKKAAPLPRTAQMLARPEPMLPQLPLLPRQRMSFRATLALGLSIVALFVPLLGLFASLLVVLPLALSARGAISRSNGRIRGMGRVVVAIILALVNIVGEIVLAQLFFTGKISL